MGAGQKGQEWRLKYEMQSSTKRVGELTLLCFIWTRCQQISDTVSIMQTRLKIRRRDLNLLILHRNQFIAGITHTAETKYVVLALASYRLRRATKPLMSELIETSIIYLGWQTPDKLPR